MKLLVIWNTAGMLSPVAEWMTDRGHKVRIVMRTALDGFGHTKSTRGAVMVESSKDFYMETIRQVRKFKPDVIHVNTSIRAMLLARIFAPRTPMVFTYNGSEVRGRESAHVETQLADRVTVSSPDLQPYGEWMDRPILDSFYDRGGRVKNTAFMVYADYWLEDTRPMAKRWCDERGIKLTLMDRTDPNFVPIPHDKMPEFLSKFEYVLDFKGHGEKLFALSKMAIESIACGCKVVHDANLDEVISDYKIRKAEDYYEMYQSLQKSSLSTGFKRLFRVVLGLLKWKSFQRR